MATTSHKNKDKNSSFDSLTLIPLSILPHTYAIITTYKLFIVTMETESISPYTHYTTEEGELLARVYNTKNTIYI